MATCTTRAEFSNRSELHRDTSERGAALVELALVLPFLVLVVFGVIDLGRVYRLSTQVKNASREGAAYAQFQPAQVSSTGACVDPANITYAALNEEAAASGRFTVTVISGASGTVVTGCNTSVIVPGSSVQVTVSTPFTLITPLAAALLGGTITVKSTTHVVAQG